MKRKTVHKTAWVALRLVTELESSNLSSAFPLKIGPPLIGMLPVYATRDEAIKDNPGVHVHGMEWEEVK